MADGREKDEAPTGGAPLPWIKQASDDKMVMRGAGLEPAVNAAVDERAGIEVGVKISGYELIREPVEDP